MKRLLLLLSLFIVLAGCHSQKLKNEAPDFELLDASHQPFHLSDYKGKAVIVLFWATWCPYCAKLMPGLETYYQKYHQQGLEIIAVDIKDEGADPVAHMKKKGFTFKLGLNGDAVAEQWHVNTTPSVFFINRQGQIIAMNHNSDPDSSLLNQIIRKILASKP